MIGRFDRTGDGAEKVLHGAGHGHHPMGLELAAVDDGIAVIEPRCADETLEHRTVGKRRIGRGEISVKSGSGFHRLLQTAGLIDLVQIEGVIDAAGTVPNDYFRAACHQQLCQSRENGRMGGTRPLRRHGGQQIGFDADAHTGLDPAKITSRRFYRSAASLHFIAFTWLQTYFHGPFLRFLFLEVYHKRTGLTTFRFPPHIRTPVQNPLIR